MAPALPPLATWLPLLELALAEDVGPGDITATLAIPSDWSGRARIEARCDLVVCGLEIAAEVFRRVDSRIETSATRADGDRAQAYDPLLWLDGPIGPILTAERTALNFMGRLCGIATHTARFVEAVAGTGTHIVDTRKTLPGWRVLDKYAVAVGGGVNHRFGLYDGILLKDNHVAAAGGVGAAVKTARAGAPANLTVQVEVESEAQATEACEAGADLLLLDNCDPDTCRRIADRWGERVSLEATGGIVLENARSFAESGVHRLSIGALTHSSASSDISLEIADGGVTK